MLITLTNKNDVHQSLISLYCDADIQNRDPAWYQALTQALDEDQGKHLQDIGTLADQRRAAHGERQLRMHLNCPIKI